MKRDTHVDWLVEFLRPSGRSERAIADLRAVDGALFQFQRRAVKAEFARSMIARLGLDLELAQFHGLTAIARMQLGYGGTRIREVTIGDLAEEMAIDPSRASRIAGHLIARGFVRRTVSQGDGRKSILVLSPAGETTMVTIGRSKWRLLAKGLAGWSDDEIAAFAELFTRYAAAAEAMITAPVESPAADAVEIAEALKRELAARQGR
jgi:DNA-binding MarR family transcriptional regulator